MWTQLLFEARKSIQYTLDNYTNSPKFSTDMTVSKFKLNDIVKISQSRLPSDLLTTDQQFKVLGNRDTEKNNKQVAVNPIGHKTLSDRVFFVPEQYVQPYNTDVKPGRKKFQYTINNYKTAPDFTIDLSKYQFNIGDVVKLSPKQKPHPDFTNDQQFEVLGGRQLDSGAKWIAIKPIDSPLSDNVYFVNQYYISLVSGQKTKSKPGVAVPVFSINEYTRVNGFITDLTDFKFDLNDVVTSDYDRDRTFISISNRELPNDQEYLVLGGKITSSGIKYIAIQPINSPLSEKVYFVPQSYLQKDGKQPQSNRGKKPQNFNINNFKNVPMFSEDMSKFQVNLGDIVTTPYDRNKIYLANSMLPTTEQYKVLGGVQIPSGNKYIALQPQNTEQFKERVFFIPQNQCVKDGSDKRIDQRGQREYKINIQNYKQVPGFIQELGPTYYKTGTRVQVDYRAPSAKLVTTSKLPKEQVFTILGYRKNEHNDKFYALLPVDSQPPHNVYFVRTMFVKPENEEIERTVGRNTLVYNLKSYKYVKNFTEDMTNTVFELNDIVITPYDRIQTTASNRNMPEQQQYIVLGYVKQGSNKLIAINPVDENGQSTSNNVYYILQHLVRKIDDMRQKRTGRTENIYDTMNFVNVPGVTIDLIDYPADVGDYVTTPYDREKTKLSNYYVQPNQMYKIVGARKTEAGYQFYAITPVDSENPDFVTDTPSQIRNRVYFIRTPYVRFQNREKVNRRKALSFNLNNYKNISGFDELMKTFKFSVGDVILTPKNTNLPTKSYPTNQKYKVIGGRITSNDKKYLIVYPIEEQAPTEETPVYLILEPYAKKPEVITQSQTTLKNVKSKHYTTSNYTRTDGFTTNLKDFSVKLNDVVTFPNDELPENQRYKVLGARYSMTGLKYIAVRPINPPIATLTDVVYFIMEKYIQKIG